MALRTGHRFMRCLAVGLMMCGAALVAPGCDQAKVPSPRASRQLTPPETFDVIMERFKRRYGIGSGGDSALRDSTQVANVQIVPDVTYVLHEPGVVSDNYQAEITVRTKVLFTVKPEPTVDDVAEEEANNAEFEPEPALLGTRTDEFTETYDLVFQDSRWQLKSRNIDDSVRGALEYALAAPENQPAPQ